MESCGLPLKSALSVSKKFQLDESNPQKPQSVLEFLKSHQFSDTQLAKLIVKYPKILHVKVKSNLHPKVEYLVDNGLAAVILRSRWNLASNFYATLRSNVDFLMNEGVSSRGVGQFLLMTGVLYQKPETMISAVNTVKNLGFKPKTPMFLHALNVVIPSNWEKKVGFLKSVGWHQDDILEAFSRFPYSLSYSEAKITKALHFYLDTMRLERKTVVANPKLLGYSIEKRIRPRYNVLCVLESKKLVEINIKPFFLTEKDFQKKYVHPHIPNVPALLDIYLGSKESEGSTRDTRKVS
ncbi:Mitochondrial transcription termination factor family protein [Euphorbia peplus]|nr:Mitochondrial transcription termination factor family protein [Euphorbia peplus]